MKQRCTYGEHNGKYEDKIDKDAVAWSRSPYGGYKVFYCEEHLLIARDYPFNSQVHYVAIEDEE